MRAVAAEGRHTVAMLRRKKSESFAQLLSRLDLTIASAVADDTFTDEVNTQEIGFLLSTTHQSCPLAEIVGTTGPTHTLALL
jgi:hypothetical protein